MEDYADILGEDGRDYAQRIEAASEHMGHILDDLMQLSNISRTEINLQPVDLGAEAATIATDLQRQDPARNDLFHHPAAGLGTGRPARIREALRNLLDNAWKFTTGRDNASIEFGMTPAANARVCCYVRDNGAGFDPAYADKLFTPFQRLHTTREFPRHRHRPRQRPPDRGPARRPHLGRGHRRRGRNVLLHPPGRRTRRATG